MVLREVRLPAPNVRLSATNVVRKLTSPWAKHNVGCTDGPSWRGHIADNASYVNLMATRGQTPSWALFLSPPQSDSQRRRMNAAAMQSPAPRRTRMSP